MILGTGSNAAFLERAERVHHWEGERHNEKNVIIDIEWGAFGDKGSIDFIRTAYDKEVDSTSLMTKSFTWVTFSLKILILKSSAGSMTIKNAILHD